MSIKNSSGMISTGGGEVTGRRMSRARLAEIRQALELRIAETSEHAVAREVGMSRGGIRNVRQGLRRPQSRTEDKLRRWYAAWRREQNAPHRTAELAIDLLLQGLPENQRTEARDHTVHFLHSLYSRHGLTWEAR